MRGELKTLIRIEHLVVAWRSGNGVRRIDEVILRRDLLVLGRMTVFRRICSQPPRPPQPPALSGTGNEYRSKCGDVVRLGVKIGMVYSIYECTCGWQVNMCEPLLAHAIPERLGDESYSV